MNFHQTSQLVGALLPRLGDSSSSVRCGGVGCVVAVLRVAARYNGHQPQQIEEALQPLTVGTVALLSVVIYINATHSESNQLPPHSKSRSRMCILLRFEVIINYKIHSCTILMKITEIFDLYGQMLYAGYSNLNLQLIK